LLPSPGFLISFSGFSVTRNGQRAQPIILLTSVQHPNKGKFKTGGIEVAAIIEEKIMNLSIKAKVAIAVATSFLLLIVGAMAQGIANAAAVQVSAFRNFEVGR
jgi:hypothetical protein